MAKKLQKIIAFALLSLFLNIGMLAYAAPAATTAAAAWTAPDLTKAPAASVQVPFTQEASDENTADARKKLEELSAAIEDIENNPCVSPQEEHDAAFITYIEEPLTVQDDPANTPKTGIVYRRCFRNTFIYASSNGADTSNGGRDAVLSRTSTKCSDKAQELLEKYAGQAINPRFTCQEIQVLINYKGGTSVLYSYISLIYRWAASIVGVIAVTVIILSAIQIAASGGDPESINKSKTRIIQSLSGIAVLFLSAIILNTINPNFFTV